MIFATLVGEGTISHLYYADRIIDLPFALVAVAISITLLPYLSKNILNEEKCLTKRELQVYEHMISGMTDKSIAKELAVTVPTIKFHLRNIYRKKDVSGRRGILKII